MNLFSLEYLRTMDDNGLLLEIFETRYFDMTRCRLPYIQVFYASIFCKFLGQHQKESFPAIKER